MTDILLTIVGFILVWWHQHERIRKYVYLILYKITKNPKFDKRTNTDIFKEKINQASRNRTGYDHFPDY